MATETTYACQHCQDTHICKHCAGTGGACGPFALYECRICDGFGHCVECDEDTE